MRQYQRFINLSEPENGCDNQSAALKESLSAAPGVSEVEIMGEHPKGGYRTQFELASGATDAFISYMESANWRVVL